MPEPLVSIVMGSDSDWPVMQAAADALAEFDGLTRKEKERAKNMFALGLLSWMYTRPVEPTEEWIQEKFAKNEQVAAANAHGASTLRAAATRSLLVRDVRIMDMSRCGEVSVTLATST